MHVYLPKLKEPLAPPAAAAKSKPFCPVAGVDCEGGTLWFWGVPKANPPAGALFWGVVIPNWKPPVEPPPGVPKLEVDCPKAGIEEAVVVVCPNAGVLLELELPKPDDCPPNTDDDWVVELCWPNWKTPPDGAALDPNDEPVPNGAEGWEAPNADPFDWDAPNVGFGRPDEAPKEGAELWVVCWAPNTDWVVLVVGAPNEDCGAPNTEDEVVLGAALNVKPPVDVVLDWPNAGAGFTVEVDCPNTEEKKRNSTIGMNLSVRATHTCILPLVALIVKFFQSVGNGAWSLASWKIVQFWYDLGKVQMSMNLIN